MDNTLEKVKSILANNLGISRDTITRDSKLVDDLYADSLDIIEFTISLEEQFGKDIPDEVMERFKTVQDIVDYLKK